MKDLHIEETTGTFLTPAVSLSASTGKCSMEGESFIENPQAFYAPIQEWIEQYIKNVKGEMEWDFRFLYLNSSSSKIMSNIFRKLKEYENEGGKITINWHYPEDNTGLLEEGECFKLVSKLSINLIPYELAD